MKICIERTDRMGDMILTLPVIQAIKEKNPKHKPNHPGLKLK